MMRRERSITGTAGDSPARIGDDSLSTVLHSWKSYTAKAANRSLGRAGSFWHPEYFDRAIRDELHLRSAAEYIHLNPVKAGLINAAADGPFSSAYSMMRDAGESPAVPVPQLSAR